MPATTLSPADVADPDHLLAEDLAAVLPVEPAAAFSPVDRAA